MKVVIVYVYGPRNAGDMALNLGAIDLLRSLNDAQILGISRFSSRNDSFARTEMYLNRIYGNFLLVPFPVDYDRNNTSRLSRLSAYFKGSLLYFPKVGHSIVGDDSVKLAIESADLVAFNGGNLMFSRNYRDNLRLKGILYPFLVAHELNKPYILLPQSIPSIENKAGRKKIMQVINWSEFCMFRESISAKKIFTNCEDNVFLDIAFFVENTDLRKASILLESKGLKEKEFIPIILRATSLGDQEELSVHDKRRTIELLRSMIERVFVLGLTPVLVVQTLKDLSFTEECKEEIFRSVGVEIPIIEEYDPLVLRGIYQNAYMVISLRLHAAIFSLSVGTRTVGIYRKVWGPKMPGIFKSLGLERMCFEFESEGSAIDEQIKSLIGNFPEDALECASQEIKVEKKKILLRINEVFNGIKPGNSQ